MPACATVMTPETEAEVLRLIAEGCCRLDVSRRTGIITSTLSRWARRRGHVFPDGRGKGAFVPSAAHAAAARRNLALAVEAAAAKRRMPLSPAEKRRYVGFYEKARKAGVYLTRAEVFIAIGRPDLASPAAPLPRQGGAPSVLLPAGGNP